LRPGLGEHNQLLSGDPPGASQELDRGSKALEELSVKDLGLEVEVKTAS